MAKKSAASKTPAQRERAAPKPAITGAVVRVDTDSGGLKRAEITERGLAAVELLAASGRAFNTIANALGVAPATLREIMERQPEVADAFALGRAAVSDELHDILMTQARKGNVTAAIWIDKARLGNNEQGPRDAPKVAQQINIIMPPAMTAEQFAALIAPQQEKQKETIDVQATR